MVKLFLKFELEKFKKYFKTRTLAKSITGLLFLAVFGFVAVGIYSFFVSGFRFIMIEADLDVRNAISLFIYEVFLLAFLGIGIFSALISGIYNLFRVKYNNWLMSTPNYAILPKVIFVRSIVNGAMPSLVMFVPAVLAYIHVFHFGFFAVIAITLSVLLLVATINAMTFLLLLFITYLYYHVARMTKRLSFSMKGLILILIVLITTTIAIIGRLFTRIDLVHLFKAEDDLTSTLSVAHIGSYFRALPTHPFALEILNWQIHDMQGAMLNLLTLLIVSIITVLLWWKLSRSFYPLWQLFQEGDKLAEERELMIAPRVTYLFHGTQDMALFKKEMLISSRNFKSVLWFLFLLFIWILEIVGNIVLGHNVARYETDVSDKYALLQAIQFIIAVYFMSAFTLRFVFPSFSIEKKTSWILGSAPLNFKKIFFSKYFFYSIFFIGLGILMGVTSAIVLGLTSIYTPLTIMLGITTTLFIVTLGLSLGALFPNTETDDPETISTSMPGLFFTAFALIYGAAIDWILYKGLLNKNILWVLVSIAITLGITGIILYLTPRLERKRVANS